MIATAATAARDWFAGLWNATLAWFADPSLLLLHVGLPLLVLAAALAVAGVVNRRRELHRSPTDHDDHADADDAADWS